MRHESNQSLFTSETVDAKVNQEHPSQGLAARSVACLEHGRIQLQRQIDASSLDNISKFEDAGPLENQVAT
jgi:hypothetical protein